MRALRAISVFAMVGTVAVNLAAGVLPEASAATFVTVRTSVASDGTQGNDMSGRFGRPAISGDGVVTAFDSVATNLVPADTNHAADVFVHDSVSGTTQRASVSSGGQQGNSDSQYPALSGNGRFVAFDSYADNLVPNDANQLRDVFAHDRISGRTVLVSAALGGGSGNGSSFSASMSADGRLVAFVSDASDLVPNDTNNDRDIFVRDLQARTTVLASLAWDGAQANSSTASPSISADGTAVAFSSFATNLVPDDTNGQFDIFVRDLTAATTIRASVATSGSEGDAQSTLPAINGDGRFVAFASLAANLVSGDTNNRQDVFLHDVVTGRTIRVSVTNGGGQANGQSVGPGVRGGLAFGPAISFEGTRIAFDSVATNLVADDTNTCDPFYPLPGQCPDIFVRDVSAGRTVRASVASGGTEGNDASTDPAMDSAGRAVAFFSAASNLVPDDTNFCVQFPEVGHCPDIFVRSMTT